MRLWLTFLILLLAARPDASFARAQRPPLDQAVGALARESGFSGTILIADKGRSTYRRSFGLADRVFRIPVADTMRFKVGSIAKLFTSVLILQLHDQGKLSVDSAAETYLPELRGAPAGRVTLQQLLNHSSGLAQWDNVGSYQQAFAKGVERYQRPLTPAELLTLCCLGPLAAPPGTRFDYNNADYFVLGRIVERLTGLSLEAALAERILRPLGLKNSGTLHWDSIVERLAPTYFYRDDTRTLINDMPVYYENWYAAADLYSSADDLAAFADALYGGRLLKPATLERMLRPGLDDYGYGLWSYAFERAGRSHRVAKRPGRVMGANSVLYRLVDRPATIVILANTNRADLDVLAQRIADLLVR